jgi:ABC-2 type transport system ATP-binding protein
MKHALVIQNLRKSFQGKEVVKGISLEIPAGKIFGLLGPNGAGKSTTINMVAGVANKDSGQIKIFGYDTTTDYVQTRRLTGVMHQEIVIDTFFTIDQALKLHAGYYGVADDPVWRNTLVERLALGPHLGKPMNKLSGGMKRRFMVAKALIHKPKFLILDEPTAGVDVELRQALWEFVLQCNQRGTTVLLTTHYLEEAEQMCEQIAIMNHGEIIANEPTRALVGKIDEKTLVLRMASPLQALPPALAVWRASLEENGSVLSLKIPRERSSLDALELVRSQGISISEIETRSPNLQEVFLKLTGGAHV